MKNDSQSTTTNDRPSHCVIGLDGSAASTEALRWALARSGWFPDLVGVSVYGRYENGLELNNASLAVAGHGTTMTDAKSVLNAAVNQSGDSGLPTVARSGRAGPCLVAEADGSRMLILGSRGSTDRATHLAPVTSFCVQHASVPVMVLPEVGPPPGDVRSMVVGLDGSPNSVAALRWAIDHIDDEGTIVVQGVTSGSYTTVDNSLDEIVERCLNEIGPESRSGFDIEIRIGPGEPAKVLRASAAETGLLVVGGRGRHGLDYLASGSVTVPLVHHPTTATVFVPATIDVQTGSRQSPGMSHV